MYVVATAGHVDHGKSTLVRALTGMEPDRLAEEQRRGLTIDLGFAWTELPSGREVAFVDVPGHERFIANMLAGVGPAPVVCFVVAADQGWQAQSTDHRDAVAALGIERGLVAITRADRATPGQLAATVTETRAQLAGTVLADAPIVTVSGTTGEGLDALVQRLDALLAEAPAPDPDARLRLWVDRSFTITGSGTVVTGSLTAGTLHRGDRIVLVGESAPRPTGVRGLHSRNASQERVTPHARVAVNLRDVSAEDAHRGDALVEAGAWPFVDVVDVRRTMGEDLTEAPQQFVVHIGTAAVTAHLRPFDAEHARLTLRHALPLQVGDRLVLRSPGSRSVFAGAAIVDVDPPPLARRGAGRRRAAELAGRPIGGDPAAEVERRGAVRVGELHRFGIAGLDRVPDGVAEVRLNDVWWVHRGVLERWAERLADETRRKFRDEPLSPGLTGGAAAALLGRAEGGDPALPDPVLLPVVVRRAGLESAEGVLRPPGHVTDLGAAEAGVARLEQRLREHPFAAPEAEDLAALGLGPRALAAAERAGRLIRLRDGVILLPQAPAQAMRRLASLASPFTTSEARQALGTTRRVAIPLLEHLDSRGWTRRIDNTRREVAR